MSKLITFFLFLFVGCSILSAVMEGGGGIVTTELSDDITASSTTIPVVSTRDFLDADYIILEQEEILYSGKTDTSFTGCTRGYNGTTATAHAEGTLAMTEGASTLNNALGFNIAATADSMGLWATVTIPFYFLTRTLPNIVMMNWSFLQGDLAIIGWFFFAAGAGLVITLALQLAGGRRV